MITASVGSLKDSCTVNVSAHTGTVTEHKDPTATRTGYDKLTCEVCGEAVTRVIPALFSDVRGDVWYSDGVDYAVEHELMNGMGDGTFAPEQAMTRAQLVTVLWRLAGSPSAAPSNFTDVPQDLWYSKAVAWAQETGVVKGMTETEFAPGQQITRAQAATIFQRYAENAGVDDGQRAELSAYPDQDTVPQWAEAGLRWAVAHAIITGTQLPGSSAVVLDPHGSATRAQMATILMRFVKACSNS